MVYCGIKLTHDSSISILDGDNLLCCLELEKLDNNLRHSPFYSTLFEETFRKILRNTGIQPSGIDYFSIDGWNCSNVFGDESLNSFQNRNVFYKGKNYFFDFYFYNFYAQNKIYISPYQSKEKEDAFILKGKNISFTHICNHITSSYCTSDFALEKEPSYILVWDGGCFPSLYYFNGDTFSYKLELFPLDGNFYKAIPLLSAFAFKGNGSSPEDLFEKLIYESSLPGKIMAFSSLGSPSSSFKKTLQKWMNHGADPAGLKILIKNSGLSSPDLVATSSSFLEDILLNSLDVFLKKENKLGENLCLAGGSFLNINWNSALRNSGLFKHIWAPPFINDSGSSIGAVCSARIALEGKFPIKWNVYNGTPLDPKFCKESWAVRECSPREVAEILFNEKEPVVLLKGSSELGPRALGNRSLLCNPCDPTMKDAINRIKGREYYRPVAPVCLEEETPRLFSSNLKDPYMLFNYRATPLTKELCPSVIHLDGSARLQTISPSDNPILYAILKEFKDLSGVGVLGNTSANEKGCGFFSSIFDCQKWCNEVGVKYIYDGNFLFSVS